MRARQLAHHLSATWLPGMVAVMLAMSGAGIAAAEVYVVRPGDTLYGIGNQYGVEPEVIASTNGLVNPDRLQVGQQLSIPGTSGTASAASAAAASGTYTVAPGDTLGGIADRFGVSLADLAAVNGISDPSYLRVGLVLTIPGVTSAAVASAAAAESGEGSSTYVVGVGDTLTGIADYLGLSARALAASNELVDPDSLQVGQRLIVPDRPELSARGGPRVSFIWPAYGEVTGYFHEEGPYWVKGYHEGLDIGASYGSAIIAAEAGTVIEAESSGWNSGYGNYVKIDHGNGLQTLYGHMSSVAVDPWQKVERGDVIGYIGSTGASTGPHLHFEVRIDGVKQDPLRYLP
ncbi:MAG: LysM peptidoglycan-binding domain-containing M23 family metallopeptidase [Dehalococcoidales bacterium]|nr:LysM peptidoglycan-binding domain-containing M23 family metallopeptidase [Dehalococcoidales bacterium]